MSGYVLRSARSAPVVPAMASIVASDEDDDDIVSIYLFGVGGRDRDEGVFVAYRTRRGVKKDA